MKKILVTGAVGQVGSELVPALRELFGSENVIAAGHRTKPDAELKDAGPFIFVDATDKDAMTKVVRDNNVGQIYHLSTILSATGESNPQLAWRVNIDSLRIVLDLAVEYKLKIFWPSSMACFGPNSPVDNTPQYCAMDPTTMYGVTKVSGELLCQYYFEKFGVDVRGLRYPGIISWKQLPGGGTTDYSVAIYYEALKTKKYECYLNEDCELAMMYMPDAVKATIDLMEAPADKVKVRTSYNLTAFSFTPAKLYEVIKKFIPALSITYKPDFRQGIADSWPNSIDDTQAREDWGWCPAYDLEGMTKDMLENLSVKLNIKY